MLREWGQAAGEAGMRLFPVFNLRGGDTEKLLGTRREVTITGTVRHQSCDDEVCGIPASETAPTNGLMRTTPSTREYSVWTRR